MLQRLHLPATAAPPALATAASPHRDENLNSTGSGWDFMFSQGGIDISAALVEYE